MITGTEIWGMMSNYSNISQGAALPAMWQGVHGWPVYSSLIWGVLLFFIGFLILGVWIYTSFAYMEIARKLRFRSPWLAWIPFARSAMILQLGDFPWGWVFLWSPLILLPLAWVNSLVGIIAVLLALSGAIAFSVLCYISHWRFFEKRGYYGWLVLVPLIGLVASYLSFPAGIAFLVILGFVAWKDVKMSRRQTSQRSSRRNSSRRRR